MVLSHDLGKPTLQCRFYFEMVVIKFYSRNENKMNEKKIINKRFLFPHRKENLVITHSYSILIRSESTVSGESQNFALPPDEEHSKLLLPLMKKRKHHYCRNVDVLDY